MNIKVKSVDSNKIFLNTLIYFWTIALMVAFLESFENNNVINIFWHFISNSVNFIVLATTIFLITLNNPIKKEQITTSNVKKLFYKIFLFCNVVITIISPIVIINSDSLNWINKFIVNILKHREIFKFHSNLIELVLIIVCVIIF